MSAKVSILMGVYNCEQYISEAIESIVKQTYTNWELIMCDDGSVDGTYAVAKKYADRYPDRIILLKNKVNLKLNATLNKCLDAATGEYIARMDADDICSPERLDLEVNFLNAHPEYSLVSCQMELFNDGGVFGRARFPQGRVTEQQLLNGSPFCHAGMLMRKDVMSELRYSIGDEYVRVEDYDLWYRLYKSGYKGFNLGEVLYSMRDDESAYARRTWQNRVNEHKVKRRIFNTFNFPFYKKLLIYRPLIIHFVPKSIYDVLRKGTR